MSHLHLVGDTSTDPPKRQDGKRKRRSQKVRCCLILLLSVLRVFIVYKNAWNLPSRAAFFFVVFFIKTKTLQTSFLKCGCLSHVLLMFSVTLEKGPTKSKNKWESIAPSLCKATDLMIKYHVNYIRDGLNRKDVCRHLLLDTILTNQGLNNGKMKHKVNKYTGWLIFVNGVNWQLSC